MLPVLGLTGYDKMTNGPGGVAALRHLSMAYPANNATVARLQSEPGKQSFTLAAIREPSASLLAMR
jgi:hypothetical protein